MLQIQKMKTSKRVGIISGRFPSTKFWSNVNHQLYAEKHGYTYIHCNYPTVAKNPYLNKIYYLKNYFHLFDYLFWIDDDAFFFDLEKDILDFEPQAENFVSFCASPDFKELKTVISSGQFLIKCNDLGNQFLESVLTTDLQEVKKWWQPHHGFFSNGDQDAMVYLLETNPAFKNKAEIYNYKNFNSRAENVLENIDMHNPFVLHFTGKPEIKWKNYLLIQKKCGIGMSLVAEDYFQGYVYYRDKEAKKDSFDVKVKKRMKIFLKLK